MWPAEEKYRALAHRPWCKIHWLRDMQSSAATPLHPVSSPRQLEFLAIRGGSTNMALKLAKVHPGSRIGLVIAGNSGRPGGACGHMDKFNRPYVDSLHHHSTQEEDVVSNWLLTHQKAEDTDPNKLFANTIGGKRRWGVTHPDWQNNPTQTFYTIQGKDYRRASAADYHDAWHVSKCLVCEKTVRAYDFDNRVRCSLVFVAGPLAKGGHSLFPPLKQGDYASTQYRTFNELTEHDYAHFIRCVEETFHAALLAMAMQGDTVAILCHVSGGIYAGKWRAIYGDAAASFAELKKVVNDVLKNRLLNGVPLGCYFERVVFSKYIPPVASSSPLKGAIAKRRPSKTKKGVPRR